jgi:hypothetical protein
MLFLLCLLFSSFIYSSEASNFSSEFSEIYEQQNVYFHHIFNGTTVHFPCTEEDKINALLFRTKRGPLSNIIANPDIFSILQCNSKYMSYNNEFLTLFTSIDAFYQEIKNSDLREECTQNILYHLRLFLHATKIEQHTSFPYFYFLKKTKKHIENLYNKDFQWIEDKQLLISSTNTFFLGMLIKAELMAHSIVVSDTYSVISATPLLLDITRNALHNLRFFLRYRDCINTIKKLEKDASL